MVPLLVPPLVLYAQSTKRTNGKPATVTDPRPSALHPRHSALYPANSTTRNVKQEEVNIVANEPVRGGYRLLELRAPEISPLVKPGQFVHLRIGHRKDLLLRRPFSVFKARDGLLSILYKAVGKGTEAMESMGAGDKVSLLGPLGNGYPEPANNSFPVLVAGGYGMAALYLVAERSDAKGIAFFGGAAASDILCVEEFEQLGWDVKIATEDGSAGEHGLVTGILDDWIEAEAQKKAELFACGPLGMLQAVGERAVAKDWKAWLSMDRNMGCGVGACLACVQRIKQPDGSWAWARVCRDGPVFECREILWENGE